jgi:mono/diheme cytochrome c family protein
VPENSADRKLRRILPLAGVAALAALGLLSGCSLQESTDKERGRALYIEKCGTCHALAQAGTTATVGPNLDTAFAEARANGFDSGSFDGIVKAQIENPRPSTKDPRVSMPAGLVEGQDAKDVAAYVASVAGVPGIQPPKAPGGPGGQIYANNGCGSCHTLQAAQSSGTTGPDLDKTLKGKDASYIEKAIVDPNADIVAGYPPNVMPSTFRALPPDQLKLLVDFLLKSANGG